MTGEPLFGDEFQARVHGPVIPLLYGRFKQYGWHDIGREAVADEKAACDLGGDAAEAIAHVIDQIGHLDGTALERMTHSEPPWLIARAELPDDEPSKAIIEKATIRTHFDSLAA